MDCFASFLVVKNLLLGRYLLLRDFSRMMAGKLFGIILFACVQSWGVQTDVWSSSFYFCDLRCSRLWTTDYNMPDRDQPTFSLSLVKLEMNDGR